MVQLTQSLAADLGPRIRVNIVHPVATETPALRQILDGAPPEMRRSIIDSERLRRSGTPGDIGYSVLYLASPAASWVTGTEMHVDGGPVDENTPMFSDL